MQQRDCALSINDFSSLFSTLMASLTSVAKRRVASLIYALFLKIKTLILPVYARLYARLMPVFLLKNARLFSNMGPSEEFGTLWWSFPKLHGFGNSDMESCILLFCNTGSSVSARQGLHAESHVDSRIQVCRFLPVKIQFISTVIWGMFRTI